MPILYINFVYEMKEANNTTVHEQTLTDMQESEREQEREGGGEGESERVK